MNASDTRLLLPLSVLLVAVMRPGAPSESPSDVVTLYARDDLRSSFDFRSGGPGATVQDGEIRLENAQLVYGVFQPDSMSFGFVRDERAAVIDLGEILVHPRPSVRDSAEEFPVSLFHTLFLEGAHFGYFGPDADQRSLSGAESFLAGTPVAGPHHLEPQLGHVYVLRTRRKGAGSSDQFFKFQVIDIVPGQSLTIRWGVVPVR